MTRMEEVRHHQRHWSETREIYSDEDGVLWMRKGSPTDRAVEAERRPGESWDEAFNRIISDGIAVLNKEKTA